MAPGAPLFSATLDDPDGAIDRLHELVDAWDGDGALTGAVGADGVHVFRLVVHEWVANLIQHATFAAECRVDLEVAAAADGVRCTIEDTSVGFDFAGQIEHQRAVLDAPGPSERGRGLLMLVTCAEDLSYRPAGRAGRQRVSFVLSDPVRGSLAPLFADAGLSPDALLAAPADEPPPDPAAPAPTP